MLSCSSLHNKLTGPDKTIENYTYLQGLFGGLTVVDEFG